MFATPESPCIPAPSPVAMSRRQVLSAISGLMLGIFVAIIASTVVANALPRIVAELGGTQSAYTWVITTELLAMTATVPLWGKLSDLYNQKLLVQLSLWLFVVGSLVAGFAGDIGVLIASRVAQGAGAGGLIALAQVIMASIVPPRDLGRYAGIFGAVFATATIAGPLVGGVMVDTSWLGWRWCFFLGVPLALAAIVLLQRTLRAPTLRRQVKVDFLGAFLLLTGISTLLVWTSLAGHQFAWGSWWTVVLVVGGVAILVLALVVESRAPEPVLPLRIFANRTVALTSIASFFAGLAMFGGTVFLSQYFQLSLGKSPTAAGLMNMPMVFGLLLSSTIAGQLISKTGVWKVFLLTGAAAMTVALCLLGTIDAHTNVMLLSGYMVVLGVGIGMLQQNLVLAAQNDVPAKDLGATTSTVSFCRSLGGPVGVSVLGAVLANRLATLVTERVGTGTTGASSGAVPDLSALPEPVAKVIREAYGTATGELFRISAPFALLTLITVAFVQQIPLKTQTGNQRLAEEAAAAN